MPDNALFDAALAQRLPLPLAQLYRRAHNAKAIRELHNNAYFLWEAGIKLLASIAIVEYAASPSNDPSLAERLQNLARPALGHWWEFIRLLVPALAEQGVAGFDKVRDLVLGRTRTDLPRAAGLDAVLCTVLEGKSGARVQVRLMELFERVVRYRNRELGHGAAGQQSGEHYERLGRADGGRRRGVRAGGPVRRRPLALFRRSQPKGRPVVGAVL